MNKSEIRQLIREEIIKILSEEKGSEKAKLVQKISQLKKKLQGKRVYENFGQKEVRNLQDEFDYSTLKYGSPDERSMAKLIDDFDDWCSEYTG
jgi:ribosomal protein L19E